jgi:hypothetical protein
VTGPLWRQLLAGGEKAAAAAVAAAAQRLAARAEALPGITSEIGPDAVRLRARGLQARAFGDRRRAADPRLAALARGEAE